MNKELPGPLPTEASDPNDAREIAAGLKRLLADASFDDILAMTPALVLQAVPLATWAELQVTRPGRRRPVTSSAERNNRPAVALVPPHTRVLALQICLEGDAKAGILRLSTQSSEGFAGTAALTAATLTSQVESALGRAHVLEKAIHLQAGLANDRDIGVAVGLVMASHVLDREAALEVLRDVSHRTNRTLADIAALVIQVGESGTQPTATAKKPKV